MCGRSFSPSRILLCVALCLHVCCNPVTRADISKPRWLGGAIQVRGLSPAQGHGETGPKTGLYSQPCGGLVTVIKRVAGWAPTGLCVDRVDLTPGIYLCLFTTFTGMWGEKIDSYISAYSFFTIYRIILTISR